MSRSELTVKVIDSERRIEGKPKAYSVSSNERRVMAESLGRSSKGLTFWMGPVFFGGVGMRKFVLTGRGWTTKSGYVVISRSVKRS